jgi:hypothetical protein
LRGAGRFGNIAAQREDEGARTPCGAILATQLIVNGSKRLIAIAADGERKRETAPHLGILLATQRRGIIGLSAARIAGQVECKPTIARKFGFRHAERHRLVEKSHRRDRLLHHQKGGSHAGLYAAITRCNLLGACEESECRLRVAKLKRGLAGPD